MGKNDGFSDGMYEDFPATLSVLQRVTTWSLAIRIGFNHALGGAQTGFIPYGPTASDQKFVSGQWPE